MTKMDCFREACLRKGETVQELDERIGKLSKIVGMPDDATFDVPKEVQEKVIQYFMGLIDETDAMSDQEKYDLMRETRADFLSRLN